MGFFKLFTNLLQYPDAMIIIAFGALLAIVILIKIDKLEKVVVEITEKINDIDTRLQNLEKEKVNLDNELDIIDKFLNGDNKKEKMVKKENKFMKQSVKAPKISSIMKLSEDETEEDK